MQHILLYCMFIWPLFLHLMECQVVFSQTFEEYNVAQGNYSSYNYNGSWYRKDAINGTYKIKWPAYNASAPDTTRILVVFGAGSSTITCINFSLNVGASYQLTFDHSYQYLSSYPILYTQWNNAYILNSTKNGTPRVFSKFTQTFVIDIPINTLCFSGAAPDTMYGPIIDNVILNCTLNYTSSSSIYNNSNSSINTSISDNYSNNNNSNPNITTNQTTTNTTTNSIPNYPSNLQPIITEPEYVNMKWVKNMGQNFNKLLKFSNIFGFGYLVNNLLNFWNIIILYYFLHIQSIIEIYRKQLQHLTYLSLQDGSLLKLLSQIFHHKLTIENTFQDLQKIPSSSTEWPSYLQMGLTSILIPNNYQQYSIMLLCFVKLLFLNLIIYLFKKFKNFMSPLFYGIKIKNINFICYQAIASAPILLIPISVVLSRHSNSASLNFGDKLNNFFLFLTIPYLIGVILVPLLLKPKKAKPKRPKQPQIRSTIIVQSEHNSIKSLGYLRTIKMNKNESAITQRMKQNKNFKNKLLNYRKQVRYYNYQFWIIIIQTFDHLLFLTVPFLIGLDCIWIFLIVNLTIVIVTLFLLIKKGHFIRQFDCKQFWFGFIIKIIMLNINLIYLLLYLHQVTGIYFLTQFQQFLSFLTLFFVVVGAIVQTVHTVANLLKWIIQIVKKIRIQTQEDKTLINQQSLKIPHKKTMQLVHARKDTEAQLKKVVSEYQNDEVNDGIVSKKSIRSIKNITYRKIGLKTQRISTVVLQFKKNNGDIEIEQFQEAPETIIQKTQIKQAQLNQSIKVQKDHQQNKQLIQQIKQVSQAIKLEDKQDSGQKITKFELQVEQFKQQIQKQCKKQVKTENSPSIRLPQHTKLQTKANPKKKVSKQTQRKVNFAQNNLKSKPGKLNRH